MVLDTSTEQVSARKLYEAEGWLETGRTARRGYEILLYEKRISTV